MRTVVLTDGQYRSAISAARTFGRAGWRVVVTQTSGDTHVRPPVFFSRYVAESRMLEGSVYDADYAGRLLTVLHEQEEPPVLLPIGAVTLELLSREKKLFEPYAHFLVADPGVLDALNDKEQVHRKAEQLGLSVPKQLTGEPKSWPVIVKPHCGEKLGLKAGKRYAIAWHADEFQRAYKAMEKLDPHPIVQEMVEGPGAGASLLLDERSRLVASFCHRRIRELPIHGGPSTCCVSVYDDAKVQAAFHLLRSFHFKGLAMVEFKGDSILEVNPRIWGSFPLTTLSGSSIALHYADAASRTPLSYHSHEYQEGVRMRFLLNDSLATASLFLHGRFSAGIGGLVDLFRAREALTDPDDPEPMKQYLRAAIWER